MGNSLYWVAGSFERCTKTFDALWGNPSTSKLVEVKLSFTWKGILIPPLLPWISYSSGFRKIFHGPFRPFKVDQRVSNNFDSGIGRTSIEAPAMKREMGDLPKNHGVVFNESLPRRQSKKQVCLRLVFSCPIPVLMVQMLETPTKNHKPLWLSECAVGHPALAADGAGHPLEDGGL